MASPVSTDSFLQWDPAQVSNFIATSIDKNIGPLFLSHNLDGLLLPYITTEHLRELGIEKLSVRLQVKKCIADLVHQHFQLTSTTTLVPDAKSSNTTSNNNNTNNNNNNNNNNTNTQSERIQPFAGINKNYVYMESLSLALSLLRETFSRMSTEQQQVQQLQLQQQQLIQQQQQLQHLQQQQLELSNPPSPSQQQLDLKRLNENFNKLKSDLIPAIRMIKESKPLPTPTLDPGPTALHALESPTFSILSANIFNEPGSSANGTSNNLTNTTTMSTNSNSNNLNGNNNANGGEKLANTRRNSLTSTVVAAGSAIAAAVNFSGSLSSNSLANMNANNGSNLGNNNNSNSNGNINGISNGNTGSNGNNTINTSNNNINNNNNNANGNAVSSSSSTLHTLANSTSNTSLNGNGSARISAYPPSSPTLASNRYSSGSILSMGTGKIIQQSVVTSDQPTVSRNSNFTLQKVTNRINTGSGNTGRPRLVETRSSSNMLTKPNIRPHTSQLVSANTLMTSNANGGGNSNNGNGGSGGNGNTSPSNGNGSGTANASTEPLKQLRASSDDSCLKILQQAMKRHHIPRDDWSKYVLVICYGDKERILKLAEKPVIIFKELQELGKHPAIMLRQLAATKEKEEDVLYEDLRIGDDIPGGTL